MDCKIIKLALLCFMPFMALGQTPAYDRADKSLRVSVGSTILKWYNTGKPDSIQDTKYSKYHKYTSSSDTSGFYRNDLPVGFGKRVVIIGSSTWANVGASIPSNGLGYKVGADLIAKGYKVFNQAISGDMTSGNISRWFSDVKSLKPDIVLLANSISNELGSTGLAAAFTSYTQNTLTMARECQRMGVKVAVYGPFAWDGYTSESFKMIKDAENVFIKNGLFVLSPLNNTANPDNQGHWWPSFTSDGTHGNDLGIIAQYEAIQPDWAETILSGRSISDLNYQSFAWKSNNPGCIVFQLEKNVKSFTFNAFFKGKLPIGAPVAQTLFFFTNGTDLIRVTQDATNLNLIVGSVTTNIPTPLNDVDFKNISLTCQYNGVNQIYKLYVDGLLSSTYTSSTIISGLNFGSFMSRPDLSFPYTTGSISRPYFSRVCLFGDEILRLKNLDVVRKGMAIFSFLAETPGLYVKNSGESMLQVKCTSGAFSMDGVLINPELKAFVEASNTSQGKVYRYTASGTGAATTISIPHGLSGITASSEALPIARNAASAGIQYYSIDATNVNIVYTVAPVSGTNNLSYSIYIKP